MTLPSTNLQRMMQPRRSFRRSLLISILLIAMPLVTAFVPSPGFSIQSRQTSASRSAFPRRSNLLARPILAAAIVFASSFTTSFAQDCDGDAVEGMCAAPTMAATSLKDLKGLKAINGEPIPDDAFDGKVVLAVNVASACGYTSSGYSMMKTIGAMENVAVVAVPCNAFGGQENGSAAEIQAFGEERVPNLIMTERSEVNGQDSHPIMKLAQQALPGAITWNFDGVYVFGKEGVPSAKFGNSASAEQVKAAVEKLL